MTKLKDLVKLAQQVKRHPESQSPEALHLADLVLRTFHLKEESHGRSGQTTPATEPGADVRRVPSE